MSILIKGLEMPKSCYDCLLCYDLMECSVSPITFSKEELKRFHFTTERHPDCPLVNVPNMVD